MVVAIHFSATSVKTCLTLCCHIVDNSNRPRRDSENNMNKDRFGSIKENFIFKLILIRWFQICTLYHITVCIEFWAKTVCFFVAFLHIYQPQCENRYCHLIGVTYKTGFVLDDWIYCTLYIHNSGLQAIQRYLCSAHFPVHRYTSTRFLSLH
jgi:hypothetical protein